MAKSVKAYVTDLDQILWYHRIESMTTEELVSRLRRETPPKPHMLAGSAWHRVLEHHQGGVLEGKVSEGNFTFDVRAEATVELPQVVELRGYEVFRVDGLDVVLAGRLDGLSGHSLIDYKLTSKLDPESYYDSSQWRAYLSIFGCRDFQYVLFKKYQKLFHVRIDEVFPFTLHRYVGMVDDLRRAIREYLEFCREYVPEKVGVAP